ncbi:MAG: chemotaxis response regulator protein-glutamate methylesterase [Bacillota bacterium]|nr:chemotaxis response regulator protein-glutamate methylesterase [Bacillota bacterium]
MINKKIKVLVVDDSMLFREVIKNGLNRDSGIEVVATASDPYMARDKIIEFEPDVMTLDIELPRMNGIEFLKRLMPQYPIPIVVVSSVNKNVFYALKFGAVDFITKPQRNTDSFINELIVKIKIASTAKVGKWKKTASSDDSGFTGTNNSLYKNSIIAIGASTGGTEAIEQVLKNLPRNIPGIVIVQHMPPVFTKLYAERLNNSCKLEVKEAEDGDLILPGRALIAAGDKHMKVVKDGIPRVHCYAGDRVNGHCPSVDVLFYSAAERYYKNSFGIILTGMGYDGAKGLLEMRKKGARTIGQDEASSVVYGMPKVAYEIGAVEKQVPLNEVADTLYKLLDNKG